MIEILLASVLAIGAAQEGVAPLTFDEAKAMAAARVAAPASIDVAARDLRLPDIRIEASGGTSRTMHPFTAEPLQTDVASTVLAIDYPLFDGGAERARRNASAARLRRLTGGIPFDDARFARLVDAFGDLYVAQREREILTPVTEKISGVAERSARLLASGEITNLTASARSDLATAHAARLLDADIRRQDAVSRLRALTGLDAERPVVLDTADAVAGVSDDAAIAVDANVAAASAAVEDNRARLLEVRAASGFRAAISGTAGVASAQSSFQNATSSGAFGIYGLRVLLSYPLLRGNGAYDVAEAEARLAQSEAERDEVLAASRVRVASLLERDGTGRRRLALLQQSVEQANANVASLERLVGAGLRSDIDLATVRAEAARREVDVLSAQVAQWKVAQLLAHARGAEARKRP